MNKLALEIFDKDGNNSRFAVLYDDASVTITETSELFDNGSIYSYPFTINVFANRHIFGTVGDIHGSRLHERIDKRRAILYAMGVPMFYGYIRLDNEADISENGDVDIKLESGQKMFQDMIDGGKANQVPLMSDVLIGMALWRRRQVAWPLKMFAYARDNDNNLLGWGPVQMDGSSVINITVDGESSPTQQYPRTLYAKGRFYNADPDAEEADPEGEPINCLNTDNPYTEDDDGTPTWPYCNVALCYQKHDFPETSKDSGVRDYTKQPEAVRGYETMPANRVNSAPNFYVIYWLRCLLKHLGINVIENQMMGVEDLRRLFFANSACEFEVPDYLRYGDVDPRYGRYQFGNNRYLPEKWKPQQLINIAECSFSASNLGITEVGKGWTYGPISKIEIKASASGISWSDDAIRRLKAYNSYLHKAYATSKCFPNEDIKSVVEMLQNAFGVRFLFSNDYKSVRIVLLRNVLGDTHIHDLKCDVISSEKEESGIRGFRLTYGKGEEDTAFFYRGFAEKMQRQKETWEDDSDTHDYSHWQLNARYKDVIQKISAFDKTCYVEPLTGNAYGIKVDQQARRYEELRPSLFEFAGYMDAEDGDCSGEEDTIKELSVGFTPAIMNDVNFETEKKNYVEKQRFALFVKENMQPRRIDFDDLQPPASYNDSDAVYDVDGKLYAKKNDNYVFAAQMAGGVVQPGSFAITSDAYVDLMRDLTATIWRSGRDEWKSDYNNVTFDISGYINEGYRLYLQDNFEPNDDGVAPVETHDWGLTLGVMRGSGEGAHVSYSPDPDDGEGNSTWELLPGNESVAHPDTCDDYGRLFDYSPNEVINNATEAISAMPRLWPDSNISLTLHNGSLRDSSTMIGGLVYFVTPCAGNKYARILMATALGIYGDTNLLQREGHAISYLDYAEAFRNLSEAEIMQYDANTQNGGLGVIIEIGSSWERLHTLHDLQLVAFAPEFMKEVSLPIVIGNDGIGVLYGRFSLKLRAEKPNPYYVRSLPEVVSTPEDAATAMQKLYTTSNTDLLNRVSASFASLRNAGWECPGDGHTATYGRVHQVLMADGRLHSILITPILETGEVISPESLADYISAFADENPDQIYVADVQHLVLDIDTTAQRAAVLDGLSAIFYAEEGEQPAPVNISPANPRYLAITNPNLRRRGLMDQFHSEESYWIRNGRILHNHVSIGLNELRSIDKTVRQRIGSTSGYVTKIQYTIHNQTGLSPADIDLLYI